jgi:Lar family restriction alleviation protein
MADLKPCPFCGEQPTDEDVGSYFVQCPECGVEGPYGSPDAKQSIAIEAWNRRTAPAQATAEIARLQGEVERLRFVLAPISESTERAEAMGRNVDEWVAYAKRLEGDAGIAAAEEFQRLRDKNKAMGTELTTLRTQLSTALAESGEMREALEKIAMGYERNGDSIQTYSGRMCQEIAEVALARHATPQESAE